MYDEVVRTQIYLGAEEVELLDRAAQSTGASRSELIRRAIRSTFGERTKEDRLRALERSAGAWTEREYTGSQYVQRLRGGGAARRTRSGLE